jgi:hypothetical protein
MSSSGVSFNSSVRVVNADDTICIQNMNPDGGFYDAETFKYEEDDLLSINLDTSDEDGTPFLGAVQDFANADANRTASVADNSHSALSATDNNIDGTGDQYYNGSGYDKQRLGTCAEFSPNSILTIPACFSAMNASMQFNNTFQLPFDETSSSSLSEYNGDASFALGEIMQQKSVTYFGDTPPTNTAASDEAYMQGLSGEDADAFQTSRSFLTYACDSFRNSFQRQREHDVNERSMGHDQLLHTSASEPCHISGHMSMAQQSAAKLPKVAAAMRAKTKLYGRE